MTTRISKRAPQLKVPAEVEKFKKQKAGETTKSNDGSVTKRRTTAKGSKELTEREGKLLEHTTEYRRTSSTAKSQSENTFVDHSDMLGRRSLEQQKTTLSNNGDRHVTVQSRDVFGIDKRATQTDSERTRGNTTTTRHSTTSRDSRGNASQSRDVTRVTTQGDTTVTRGRKDASGSELTTRSSTTYENGVFRLADQADWGKNKSLERSFMKETEFDAKPYTDKADKVLPWVGKIFKALGLEETWESAVSPERMHETSLYSSDKASVATRVGITGGQSASIDHDGITGHFNREAVAGIYAEAQDHVSGKYGEAGYHATAKAEARASIDAQGRLDSNGLNATVNARVGASVEATIDASAATRSVTIGGVEMNAGVDGHARASAEAVAEATGTVQITRDPPTAIAQGTAGASAVAKVEGEIKLHAGPFSVVGNAYASAGAEARASGIIGYQDGKLKLGGSLGAALGVGAGAGVTVEVDVAAIGEAAKGLADVDGDGELGLGDVVAAGKKLVHVAENVTHALDANGDGHLGIGDLFAAARHVVGGAQHTVAAAEQKVAQAAVKTFDFSGDGRLSGADAGALALKVGEAAAKSIHDRAAKAEKAVHDSAVRVAHFFGL